MSTAASAPPISSVSGSLLCQADGRFRRHPYQSRRRERERREAASGLNVHGNEETVLSRHARAGARRAIRRSQWNFWFRPYIRGGATFFDDPDFVLLASFEGAPGGVGPFRIATATDDVVADGLGGRRPDRHRRAPRSASIMTAASATWIEEHAGGIKGTLPFESPRFAASGGISPVLCSITPHTTTANGGQDDDQIAKRASERTST